SDRDWSSDVCSSDLPETAAIFANAPAFCAAAAAMQACLGDFRREMVVATILFGENAVEAFAQHFCFAPAKNFARALVPARYPPRSEERRVGKGGISP